MLVQSGKPVGVMRTHEWAPRVLIANSNLVGDWANWEEFRRLEQLGLTMYGQMTAGSWIYIGTQGILQGTYETFAAVAEKRFGGTLAGTLTVTGGCGGMGGAQPLAVTMNDGVACASTSTRRACTAASSTATSTQVADGLDDAIARLRARQGRAARPVRRPGRQRAVGAARTAAPRRRRSTSSPTRRRPTTRCPTCPRAWTSATGTTTRARKPEEFTDRARASMARHVEAMVGFQDAGAEVFDYGNSIRDEARRGGFDRAFAFPGFVPAYIRPLFCEGKGPFRWAALSGDPKDIARHRPGRARPVPRQRAAAQVDQRRAGAGRVPGPARPHLLARVRRARQGGRSVQRDGRLRRAQRPGRHRPRPPRLRLGRVAVPRDRGHGRRLRRDRRLAAAQRDGQHRVGCLVGVDPPRRRRRHRPVDPRRPGHRRRRHARSPRPRSSGCSPTTPAWASSGTSTPATRPTTRRCRRTRRAESACRWGAHDFDRLWDDLAPVGREGSTGGYRRYAWTRDRRDPARVVRRRGGRAGARSRGRPGRQPVGVVGRPGRVRTGCRRRLAPGLGARRRRLRRAARRGERAAHDRCAARSRIAAVPAGRRRELRRRGRRAVRRRLRRVADGDRHSAAGSRAGAA